MAEPGSFQYHTKFDEVMNSAMPGSVDININVLVPGIESAFKVFQHIKQLAGSVEAEAVEKLFMAFQQLQSYQKIVSELKSVHNLLHELELTLVLQEPDIIKETKKKNVDFGQIKSYHTPSEAIIDALEYFASNKMKFLNKPFTITGDGMFGPKWMIEIYTVQRDLRASLWELNAKGVAEKVSEMRNTCKRHLFLIDKQLYWAVLDFEKLFEQILGRMENG